MSRFTGEKVLVTGGRRGLGFAFARAFALEGADVRISTRHVHEGRSAAKAIAEGTRAEVDVIGWDMNDAGSTAVLEASVRANPPTILVHAAHDLPSQVPVVGLRPDDLIAAVTGYLAPSFTLLRTVAQQMIRERRGKIILLSCLATELGPPGQASYVASKAALDAAATVLASEAGDRGVGVVIVRPGIVDTENFRERVSEEARAMYEASSGLGPLLLPDEVARVTLDALLAPATSRPRILRIGAVDEPPR